MNPSTVYVNLIPFFSTGDLMNLKRNLVTFSILVGAMFSSSSLLASSDRLVPNPTEVDTAIGGQISFATCSDARPNAYLDLCNRFSTEQGTVRCIAAGRGAYYADCSLTLCRRFNTEEGAIRCLEAARNKTYTTEEMDLCSRFTTEGGAVDCLRSAGAPNGGGDSAVLQRVRRDIELALGDISAGRTRQAVLILEDTLRVIDSSFDSMESK
jgi:hypothetical protein